MSSSVFHVNLDAFRCPDATLLMRRALDSFLQRNEDTMELRSIEPSLERSLSAVMVSLGLPLHCQSHSQRPITQESLSAWEGRFDEEDYDGVKHINVFIIKKASPSCDVRQVEV